MAAMLKKLPAVFAGLLLTLTCYAATVQLADNHPDTYVVQKGDTLWSISRRFLRNPWDWPEVWQANQQIPNPHLIYPGQVLNLAYVNGRARITNEGFGPHVRAEPLDEAIKPLPLSAIEDFLKKPRMIGEDEFRNAPHVVAMEDHHINGTPGEFVYVRGLSAPEGTKLVLARPIGRYYEITGKDGAASRIYRESLEETDDRQDMLWHTGPNHFTLHGDVHFIGYEMLQYGTVQVTKAGDPASTLALASDYEIRRGDLVLTLDPMSFDFQYFPHPPAHVPPEMRVTVFTDALNAVGRLQVVGLSAGSADGVENGQVYSIFHAGDQVEDLTDYPEFSVKNFFHPHDKEVQLPEEYVGHVMIFRTFDRVSYGLVMDGIRPVHVGDRLYEPDHR